MRACYLNLTLPADQAVRLTGDIVWVVIRTVKPKAGQDIAIRGGDIDAGQALQLTAGRDVRIENAESTSHLDQIHTSSSSSGFLSSARDTRTDRVDTTSASASNLGGKTVAIGAGRDIAVQGSNVVSDERTVLLARRDIAITAATDTRDEEHTRDQKKSGLSGTGGLGVTAGVQQTQTRMRGTSTTAAASTVGSIGGDVTIGAGNRYTQVGSDVVAPAGDITIAARDVAITEARETSRVETEQRVARLVLEDARTFASLPVTELADRPHVSKPTVVRFCHSIGYDGYSPMMSRLLHLMVIDILATCVALRIGEPLQPRLQQTKSNLRRKRYA